MDYTTRQYIAHMLSLIGMSRKASLALTTATESDLKVYVDVIKLVAERDNDLQEFLDFSGVA